MDEKRWDLHMHSTCSDGTYEPEKLIDEAKRIGLTGISITDHDTVLAYTPKLFNYAKENGIELITGVEFSTMDQERPVHILGYHFDINDSGLKGLCEAHKERRRLRNLAILKALKKYNVHIEEEELLALGTKTIGRPHIARLMIDRGVVSTIQEAFDHWLGDGKKCYVQGKKFSQKEAIEVIHQAKGKAVLAHPILLKKKAIIKTLLENNSFDGMECYYAAFSQEQNEQIVKIAEKFNLVMTGGSDFHGEAKPYLKVGSSYTNENQMNRLKEGL